MVLLKVKRSIREFLLPKKSHLLFYPNPKKETSYQTLASPPTHTPTTPTHPPPPPPPPPTHTHTHLTPTYPIYPYFCAKIVCFQIYIAMFVFLLIFLKYVGLKILSCTPLGDIFGILPAMFFLLMFF